MYFFSLLFVFFLLLLEDLPLNIAKIYRLINIHFVGHFWFRFLLKTMPNPFHFLFFMNILGRMIYFKWYNTISAWFFFVHFLFSTIQFTQYICTVLFPLCGLFKIVFFRKKQNWEYLLVKISNNQKKPFVYLIICVCICLGYILC